MTTTDPSHGSPAVLNEIFGGQWRQRDGTWVTELSAEYSVFLIKFFEARQIRSEAKPIGQGQVMLSVTLEDTNVLAAQILLARQHKSTVLRSVFGGVWQPRFSTKQGFYQERTFPTDQLKHMLVQHLRESKVPFITGPRYVWVTDSTATALAELPQEELDAIRQRTASRSETLRSTGSDSVH